MPHRLLALVHLSFQRNLRGSNSEKKFSGNRASLAVKKLSKTIHFLFIWEGVRNEFLINCIEYKDKWTMSDI